MSESNVLANAEEVSSVEDTNIVEYNSPEWHSYVMSLFQKDEMVDGTPTCDGLRRVVGVALGDIISSKSKVIQSPTLMDRLKEKSKTKLYYVMTPAVVEHTVVIETKTGSIIEITDIGSSYIGNTDIEYVVHAPETAATKAESRCYRKALKLKKVISQEENSQPIEFIEDEMITKSDISIIKILADKKGLDIDEILQKLNLDYTVDTFVAMKREEAKLLIAHLQGK